MPGKPFQSKLKPYEDEIYRLLREGRGYRGASAFLNEKYLLGISHNALFSYVKAKSRSQKMTGKMFYDGLDADLRDSLMKQVVAVWTHDSTAIEGNTLTLGETVKVLEFGLTINGKPLKDHQEVYGHARAIEIIQEMLHLSKIRERHLFDLHAAIMPSVPLDVQKPVGEWKREYNGTTGVLKGKVEYLEYSAPADVPFLMKRWLECFNGLPRYCRDRDEAISAYSRVHMVFVRIHPFFDGNGRMARLLANIPVLRSGFPPIVLSPERRMEYIDILWNSQASLGKLARDGELLPEHKSIGQFNEFLAQEWKNTADLVEAARKLQDSRKRS